MTRDDVLDLITRLRDLSIIIHTRNDAALASELRSYANELDSDLLSGKLPFPPIETP
jgi:hypothetical protein